MVIGILLNNDSFDVLFRTYAFEVVLEPIL